jgi:DNA-binding IclR family transcriptional regulator
MEEKMIKILQLLDRVECPCPLSYITLHTSIIEPLEFLEVLEKQGYVQRSESKSWSPSSGLKFKITPNARQKLRDLEAEVVRVPLQVVADTYAINSNVRASKD